jgi:hypothetical protein
VSLCNLLCTYCTIVDILTSHAGWLRSSNKPTTSYAAMKAVLTLRTILAEYPFRLGTHEEFYNECSDAVFLFSTLISCLKDHLSNVGELDTLVSAHLATTTYDGPVQETVLKFMKDFYNEQLKLAEKAGGAPTMVKFQVNLY